ncbi:MAG TPA: hypothetical protein DDW56_18530, partial [Cyanobacteria bacterium UBA11366]|nr:hypothetical protein [Cyanobacteria bacterium UBA11366]
MQDARYDIWMPYMDALASKMLALRYIKINCYAAIDGGSIFPGLKQGISLVSIRHLQNINYGLPVGAGRSIR